MSETLNFVSLTSLKQYAAKSFDEFRLEDMHCSPPTTDSGGGDGGTGTPQPPVGSAPPPPLLSQARPDDTVSDEWTKAVSDLFVLEKTETIPPPVLSLPSGDPSGESESVLFQYYLSVPVSTEYPTPTTAVTTYQSLDISAVRATTRSIRYSASASRSAARSASHSSIAGTVSASPSLSSHNNHHHRD